MDHPRHTERFDWRWMIVGLLLLLLANLGVWQLVGEPLRAMVERGQVALAFALAAATPLTIYFLCGLFVARMSHGETCREPAVAAALSVVAVFGVHLFAGMVNVFGLLIGAPFCFGAAYLGGCLGERWQQRRRRGRSGR